MQQAKKEKKKKRGGEKIEQTGVTLIMQERMIRTRSSGRGSLLMASLNSDMTLEHSLTSSCNSGQQKNT